MTTVGKISKAKTSMALFFIKAAYRFYQQTKHFESQNERPNEDFNAAAIGGIISSASFIECFINEVYTDISERYYVPYFQIPQEKLTLIENLWNRNIPRTARFKTLDKYDIFLELIGGEPFDKGKYPYQDADVLIEIRNKLVHYEPKWIRFEDAEQEVSKNRNILESKLRGRFEESKLHKLSYFSFPHYCLSSSCLLWAFKTARDIALEFGKKSKMTTVLQNISWDDVK